MKNLQIAGLWILSFFALGLGTYAIQNNQKQVGDALNNAAVSLQDKAHTLAAQGNTDAAAAVAATALAVSETAVSVTTAQ